MLHLAIECSDRHGSVALCEETEAIAVVKLPINQSSAQSLAPTIDSLIKPRDPTHPRLISVTVGPGSFTGLRVGITTAKMLAYAWDIPIAGVDTLDVIAEQQKQTSSTKPQAGCHTVVAVINAYRNQVFSAAWTLRHNRSWERLADSQVVDATLWQANPLEALSTKGRNTTPGENLVVSGPGLAVYKPELNPGIELADPGQWSPQVEYVARLGWKAYQSGEAQTAAQLLPKYVRLSAAEEKAKQSKI